MTVGWYTEVAGYSKSLKSYRELRSLFSKRDKATLLSKDTYTPMNNFRASASAHYCIIQCFSTWWSWVSIYMNCICVQIGNRGFRNVQTFFGACIKKMAARHHIFSINFFTRNFRFLRSTIIHADLSVKKAWKLETCSISILIVLLAKDTIGARSRLRNGELCYEQEKYFPEVCVGDTVAKGRVLSTVNRKLRKFAHEGWEVMERYTQRETRECMGARISEKESEKQHETSDSGTPLTLFA